jgi:hypothetical protein
MRKGGQLNAITHSMETFYGSKRVRGCLAHGKELSVYIVVIRYWWHRWHRWHRWE